MKSYPFTSLEGDRKITALEFREIFRKYFTNGVFANPSTEFQVVENSGMTVLVKKGYANINGCIAFEDQDRTLNIEASDSQDRIDRVVLRLNDNTESRKIDLYVVKGTPAEKPTAPELTRNDSVYDLCLATVYVNGSTTNITQSKITDTRLDSSVCGVVSGTIKEVDTTEIFTQYQAALDEYLHYVEEAIDGTLAGQIQQQITEINENLVLKQNNVIVGTSDNPSAEIGIDGDIYIRIEG